MRILFVDDEEAMVLVGGQMLEWLGHETSCATSPRQALDLFRREAHAFDVVITDHTMPGMKGLELAEELLKIRRDIPVFLTTGCSELVPEEDIRAVGIRGVFLKPLKMNALNEAMDKL